MQRICVLNISEMSMILRTFLLATLLLSLVAGCGSADTEDAGESQTHSVKAVDTAGAGRTGGIRVESPRRGDTLEPGSFRISGQARTFENTVLYRLIFDDVLVLVKGFTTANASEVGQFGPFSLDVAYNPDWSGNAVLEVYEEDAESGKEVNMVRIPVVIRVPAGNSKDAQSLYAYFANSTFHREEKQTEDHCSEVYPVRYQLRSGSQALARGALYYLLKGPDEAQTKSGYRTYIPAGTRLEKVAVENGVATLGFNSGLNRIPNECERTAVHAQIEQTLAQFPNINAVAINVDGRLWSGLR